MHSLRAALAECLRGRVCVMGLGNVVFGDDGFGVRLAEALLADGWTRFGSDAPEAEGPGAPAPRGGRSRAVLIAGTAPERFVGSVAAARCDSVLFVDAVDFAGEPGSAVLLDAAQMRSRFPQVSTHRLSLGLLADWVEAEGRARAWLLGVQPQSLAAADGLSPAAAGTLDALRQALNGAGPGEPPTRRGRPPQEGRGERDDA